jgi:hypothetical protein
MVNMLIGELYKHEELEGNSNHFSSVDVAADEHRTRR